MQRAQIISRLGNILRMANNRIWRRCRSHSFLACLAITIICVLFLSSSYAHEECRCIGATIYCPGGNGGSGCDGGKPTCDCPPCDDDPPCTENPINLYNGQVRTKIAQMSIPTTISPNGMKFTDMLRSDGCDGGGGSSQPASCGCSGDCSGDAGDSGGGFGTGGGQKFSISDAYAKLVANDDQTIEEYNVEVHLNATNYWVWEWNPDPDPETQGEDGLYELVTEKTSRICGSVLQEAATGDYNTISSCIVTPDSVMTCSPPQPRAAECASPQISVETDAEDHINVTFTSGDYEITFFPLHPDNTTLGEIDNKESPIQTIENPEGDSITNTYYDDYKTSASTIKHNDNTIWTINYYYLEMAGDNNGLLAQIYVKDASGKVIQKRKNTYFIPNSSHNDDLDESVDMDDFGQLVMVEIFTRGTSDSLNSYSDGDFSLKRVTQYRWDDNSRIKMILDSGAIEQIIANNANVDTPADVLDRPDSEVDDYASNIFTYYESDLNTASIPTTGDYANPFGDTNLQTKYGADNFSETGFAASETIRNSNGEFVKQYYYMEINDSELGINDVDRITVEDTSDLDGNALYRKVTAMNKYGYKLRELTIENPNPGQSETSTFWGTSYIRGTGDYDLNLTVEKRLPSAHLNLTATNIHKFLDPTGGASYDSDTFDNSNGIVEITQYDYSDYDETGEGSYVIYKGVTRGENGTSSNYGYVNWQSYEKYATETSLGSEWAVYRLKETYKVSGMAPATYVTTSKPNPATISSDDKTLYAYTFHSVGGTTKQKIATRTITYPKVESGSNGSGVAIKKYEYYDTLGRLRWTKDGEGHVNYYAYNTVQNTLAYKVEDINTTAKPAYVSNPPDVGAINEWCPWTGVVPTGFVSNSGLSLETQISYDSMGRITKQVDPDGQVTHLAHLGPNKTGSSLTYDETRIYRAWNSTTDKPELPVEVTRYNEAGDVVEEFSVDPTSITFADPPTGSETLSQSAYTSWTSYKYYSPGKVKYIDRYYDIPSSGSGTLSTNFTRTVYRYDDQGRKIRVIDIVDGSASISRLEQVTAYEYDILDRITAIKTGVSPATSAGSMGDDYDTDPTLATTEKRFYDESSPGSGTSGIGTGVLTSVRKYHGTGASDYTSRKFYINWRGQLRGIAPEGGPYVVNDLDNQNDLVAIAFYNDTTALGTDWANVLSNETFAASTTTAQYTDRRSMVLQAFYDKMQRIYQIQGYVVDADDGSMGNKFILNAYRDRNNRVVATSGSGSVAREIAYDGAGRRYQQRVVTAIEDAQSVYHALGDPNNSFDIYNSSTGAYRYREPEPNPDYDSMTGGDEGVIQLQHLTYDSDGNIENQITAELNHGDADGLDFTNDDDYIQTAIYKWYDEVGRLATVGNYGSGDTTTDKWKYVALPTNSPSEPSASSNDAHVIKYTYNSTGILETITDPEGIVVKVIYDDLGRKTHVSENQTNFDGSSGTGGGTNSDQDRVTKFKYNGLSRVIELIAMDTNGDGTTTDNQTTKYLYENSYFAGLVTNVIYPDSSDTGSTGTNQVKLSYNLDGSLAQRTDQNQTVIDFTYNSRRQLEMQKVTTLGNNVDGHVRSIKIGYDDLTRPETITSYSDTAGTGTVRNQVKYHYNDLGQILKEYQSHEGVVDDDGSGTDTPVIQYIYDDSASSGELTNGMRLSSVIYPDGSRQVHYTYGSDDSIADLLHRIDAIKDDSSGSPGNALVSYSFNGLERFVKVLYDQTDASTNDVRLDYTSSSAGMYDGFDRFGRVIDQRWKNTSSDLDRFEYAYDYAGNRTSRDIPSGLYTSDDKDQQYSYDDLHRLINYDHGTLSSGSISSPNREQDFDLDQLGNWAGFDVKTSGTADLVQTRTHNAANEISTIARTTGPNWWAPTYDDVGNVTAGPLPDLEGYSSSFRYDAWNRLVEVIDPADYSLAKYEYDGLSRRIVKTDAPESSNIDYDYFYNIAWQTLEIRKNDDADPLKQYVWDARYIDAPVIRYYDENTDGSGIVTHYYTNDANMNVTALLSDNGAVLERYEYDPYGKAYVLDINYIQVTGNISAYDNEILYAGYRHDPESGLYHVRFRMYHPSLGRWMQNDPLGYHDSMNTFVFDHSNPLRFIDYYGTISCKDGKCPVKDDTGRECCPERLGEVVLYIRKTNLRENESGHVFIGTYPSDYVQIAKEQGFYPIKGPDSVFDVVPGIARNDTGTLADEERVYLACDNTIKRLWANIRSHKNDNYNALNFQARNCAGWALSRLQDLGFPMPIDTNTDEPIIPDDFSIVPNRIGPLPIPDLDDDDGSTPDSNNDDNH